MKLKTLLAISATAVSLFAAEEVMQTELFETLPEGWSVIEGGGFISPEYPNEIRRVAIAFSLLTPGGDIEVRDYASQEKLASVSGKAVSAELEFPEGVGIRRLELRPNGTRLESFGATWLNPLLPAPGNFTAADSFNDSVQLMWDAVDGAQAYKVTVWTNAVTGASEGTESWRETFKNIPESSSSQQMSKDHLGNADHGADWKNQSFSGLYHLSQGGGIRLGKTDGAGEITVPHILAEGENLLRISAFQYGNSKGQRLGICAVSADGSIVNDVVELDLTAEEKEYRVILPDDAVGGKVLLKSMSSTQDCRVGIVEISIWKGFSEGQKEKAAIAEKVVGESSAVVGKLPEGEVFASVAAVSSDGNHISSSPAEITFSLPDLPRKMLPGSKVLSGYTEGFECLSRGVSGWFDGKTVPYFLAANNGEAVAKIAATSGTGSKSGGLYAFHGSGAETYSLAAVANSNNKLIFGFCVSNDTTSLLKNFELSFTAKQWTFDVSRAAQQNLRLFAIEGASSLKEGADEAVEIVDARFTAISKADFEAKVDGVDAASYSRRITVDVGGIELKPGEKAVFYWAPDQVSHADALGIDDISLTCGSEPTGGLAVHIAAALPLR